MNLSYWEKDAFFKAIDLAVIGSGIVGLSAAISWTKRHPKSNVVVLERNILPSGASTKNAGFACFGSPSELIDDLKTDTEQQVFALVQKRWEGLSKLRALTGDDAINFLPTGSYECFRAEDDSLYIECRDQLSYLNKQLKSAIGVDAVYKPTDEAIPKFGFKGIKHLIHNSSEGQLHTGKMMVRLLDVAKSLGITILNGAEVTAFEDGTNGVDIALKDNLVVNAAKVVVATNGFARNLLPDKHVFPARNQILVTSPIPDLSLKSCFFLDKGYVYFRNIGDRVLIGGARNLAFEEETTSEFGLTEKITSHLTSLLKHNLLPDSNFQIAHQWSGIMGVGPVKTPIVKKVSPNVVVAVRLGGMGVAIGVLVGEEGVECHLIPSPSPPGDGN
ncbi:MAG: FAD-dependent oxidoreductase [Bacteroidota bacterium]